MTRQVPLIGACIFPDQATVQLLTVGLLLCFALLAYLLACFPNNHILRISFAPWHDHHITRSSFTSVQFTQHSTEPTPFPSSLQPYRLRLTYINTHCKQSRRNHHGAKRHSNRLQRRRSIRSPDSRHCRRTAAASVHGAPGGRRDQKAGQFILLRQPSGG